MIRIGDRWNESEVCPDPLTGMPMPPFRRAATVPP